MLKKKPFIRLHFVLHYSTRLPNQDTKKYNKKFTYLSLSNRNYLLILTLYWPLSAKVLKYLFVFVFLLWFFIFQQFATCLLWLFCFYYFIFHLTDINVCMSIWLLIRQNFYYFKIKYVFSHLYLKYFSSLVYYWIYILFAQLYRRRSFNSHYYFTYLYVIDT